MLYFLYTKIFLNSTVKRKKGKELYTAVSIKKNMFGSVGEFQMRMTTEYEYV